VTRIGSSAKFPSVLTHQPDIYQTTNIESKPTICCQFDSTIPPRHSSHLVHGSVGRHFVRSCPHSLPTSNPSHTRYPFKAKSDSKRRERKTQPTRHRQSGFTRIIRSSLTSARCFRTSESKPSNQSSTSCQGFLQTLATNSCHHESSLCSKESPKSTKMAGPGGGPPRRRWVYVIWSVDFARLLTVCPS